MTAPTSSSGKWSEFVQGATPQTNVCLNALSLAHDVLPEAIFNHSFRVYLLAKWLASKEQVVVDDDLLFIASICHDLGASDVYNGSQRFEVEGADAACKIMQVAGCHEADCHKVWTAIALHTSAGIAERIDPFTRLVRLGVKLDLSPAMRDSNGATTYAKSIEKHLSRLGIEKALADAVVSQATDLPAIVDNKTWPDSLKYPKASWPGILLRSHLENPEWEGINYAF